MKKLILLIILTSIFITTSNAQPCLPEGITFKTQAQIDSFQIIYPGCTEIEGDVEIKGEDITNLNGLNVLTSIGGYLDFNNNNNLTSLMGLSNLTFLGGYLRIIGNDTLQSLNGLEGLSTISDALTIYVNPNLINLSGLDNIASIGEDLIIDLNFELEDLSGLENLIFIGGDLYIGGVSPAMWMGNEALSTITNLENLSSVGGKLVISGNWSLVDLSGIENIDAGTISYLEIWRNINLSSCSVHSICDYLAAPNGDLFISENAPGCNSPEEVEEACGLSVNEIYDINDLLIHPNPFTTSTTIKYELSKPSTIQLTIYDYLGKQVELIEEKQTQGKQQIVWNAEVLPAGVHFCVLKTNEGSQTIKLVKL